MSTTLKTSFDPSNHESATRDDWMAGNELATCDDWMAGNGSVACDMKRRHVMTGWQVMNR